MQIIDVRIGTSERHQQKAYWEQRLICQVGEWENCPRSGQEAGKRKQEWAWKN